MVAIIVNFVVAPVSNILMSWLDTKWSKLRRLHIKTLKTKSLKKRLKVLVINKLWINNLPKLTN
jgi:hypothetical protein